MASTITSMTAQATTSLNDVLKVSDYFSFFTVLKQHVDIADMFFSYAVFQYAKTIIKYLELQDVIMSFDNKVTHFLMLVLTKNC